MSETVLNLDLDAKKVLESLKAVSEESMALAKQIEDSLGKDAPKQFNDFEQAAENGTNKVSTYFRNLSSRIKDDLKTAFDVAGVMSGMKFAKELGEGVKQVFEMERAFDRLNTRLGLSTKQLNEFKKNLGSKVAETGQKIEDILPGAELLASKGQMKSPEDIASVAETLSKVRATTGENVEGVADSIVEILKSQQKAITGENVKTLVDAMQGARVQGGFKSVDEVSDVMRQLAPFAKQLKMTERDLAAMSAVASRGGERGTDILKGLMEAATRPGAEGKLNAIFGQQVIKDKKINAEALSKVDVGRFGQYSQQIMESATELHGASGADLARFVDSFKNGLDSFNKVVSGSNETADQFEIATDNFATKLDRFREKTKEASREIGSELSSVANSLFKGDFKKAYEHFKSSLGRASENKGTIAGAVGLTAAVGVLAGGGLNSILKKMPGGGLLSRIGGAAAAEAAGVQKVYVTNYSDFNMAGGAEKAMGIFDKMGDIFKKSAPGAIGLGTAGVALAGTGAALYGIAKTEEEHTKGLSKQGLSDYLSEAFSSLGSGGADGAGYVGSNRMYKPKPVEEKEKTNDLVKSIKDGVVQGMKESQEKKQVIYTNKSSVSGRGP